MDGAVPSSLDPQPAAPTSSPPLWRVSLAYALTFTAGPISITSSPLLGERAAPDPALATLPLALQLVAMMAAGIPASFLMERIGRRRGFQLALFIGIIGTVLLAVSADRFSLLIIGSICMGLMLGASQLFRFAAAEMAPARASRAVGTVLAGGVAAAVVGPGIVFATTRWTTFGLAGAFGAAAVLALVCMVLLETIPFAALEPRAVKRPPVRNLLRRPILIGIGAAALGYGTMSVLMSATPLAMRQGGYGIEAISIIILLHGLAMFTPSFWTGRLIERHGAGRIMVGGWIFLTLAYAVSLASDATGGFVVALVLLGLGWNGMFVAGTSMVSAAQRSGEAARLQGFNDLFVLGSAAAGSLLSGALIATVGWGRLQIWLLAILVVAGALLAVAGRRLPAHGPATVA